MVYIIFEDGAAAIRGLTIGEIAFLWEESNPRLLNPNAMTIFPWPSPAFLLKVDEFFLLSAGSPPPEATSPFGYFSTKPGFSYFGPMCFKPEKRDENTHGCLIMCLNIGAML